MKSKNMTNKEFALQILQQTYPFDDREMLDQYINGRGWDDPKTLIRMIETEFGSSANETAAGEVDTTFVENIAYGMNYYIRSYKAVPTFKQKIWYQFREWLLCIGKKYDISDIEEIADAVLEKPVEEDLAVAVVKALHAWKMNQSLTLYKRSGYIMSSPYHRPNGWINLKWLRSRTRRWSLMTVSGKVK